MVKNTYLSYSISAFNISRLSLDASSRLVPLAKSPNTSMTNWNFCFCLSAAFAALAGSNGTLQLWQNLALGG